MTTPYTIHLRFVYFPACMIEFNSLYMFKIIKIKQSKVKHIEFQTWVKLMTVRLVILLSVQSEFFLETAFRSGYMSEAGGSISSPVELQVQSGWRELLSERCPAGGFPLPFSSVPSLLILCSLPAERSLVLTTNKWAAVGDTSGWLR